MRAIQVTFIFFLLSIAKGQDFATEQAIKLISLCNVCTCGEITDVDDTHIVLNIQCSELDRIESVPDLDKIEWPENPNGLNISATFEGLGLTTLGKLPSNPQVESLRFNNNAIKAYWPDPFSDVINLKSLSLARNELTEITPDLFSNINLLEDLDLSFNRLSSFNPLDFKSLHRLKKLNLQSNQLKSIPVETLQPLVVLEDLDLSRNGVYDVLLRRSESSVFKNIRRLNLNGNRIRSVTKDSFPLDNKLELLDMSNNIIELVDEEAFLSCSSLRELNIGQNNITRPFSLPPTLQIAILKINFLHQWPNFPPRITYIDLSYNRLNGLYDEKEANFDNLEILNVGGNHIQDINLGKKVPKLFSLDLSYNSITEIPKSLNSQILPNLDSLRLDGNPIEAIYFKNIIALKVLYMNDLSKLTSVQEKSFSNVIGRSNYETEDFNNCFSLYLSNCRALSEIREGAFDGTSLCMLDLSNNNLTYLSPHLVDWSQVREGVNLQANPWHCVCDLQWVLSDLLPSMYNKHSMLLNELRCGSPRALEGLRLVHWYNWTERAMCDDNYLRTGPRGTYYLQPSTENSLNNVTTLTIILGSCIVVSLLIAIALSVYLVKSRRRHKIRQAALKRKRQSAVDAKRANGFDKEQFSALNKV